MYLWTLTVADLRADSYIAHCRQRLLLAMRGEERAGRMVPFAGVRVTEVHPSGHGLHDHWVMSFGCALEQNTGMDKRFRK